MVDRIRQIMQLKQMSIAAFADYINVNRSSMTHIFNGRNQPSLDVAKKILTAFPDISTEWLIMGVGNMTQAVAPVLESQSNSLVDHNRQTELFANAYKDLPAQNHPIADSSVISTSGMEQEQGEKDTQVIDTATESVHNEELQVFKPAPTPSPSTPKNRKSPESHNSGKDAKHDRISYSQGDKKLVKIVFFYGDRSFEEYFPS